MICGTSDDANKQNIAKKGRKLGSPFCLSAESMAEKYLYLFKKCHVTSNNY